MLMLTLSLRYWLKRNFPDIFNDVLQGADPNILMDNEMTSKYIEWCNTTSTGRAFLRINNPYMADPCPKCRRLLVQEIYAGPHPTKFNTQVYVYTCDECGFIAKKEID